MRKNKVTRKGDVIKVKAGAEGYGDWVIGKTILKLTNNGNGWTAKFPSHSSVIPTTYINLDYDQICLLVEASKKMTRFETE